jgi:hypothetical protein
MIGEDFRAGLSRRGERWLDRSHAHACLIGVSLFRTPAFWQAPIRNLNQVRFRAARSQGQIILTPGCEDPLLAANTWQ